MDKNEISDVLAMKAVELGRKYGKKFSLASAAFLSPESARQVGGVAGQVHRYIKAIKKGHKFKNETLPQLRLWAGGEVVDYDREKVDALLEEFEDGVCRAAKKKLSKEVT